MVRQATLSDIPELLRLGRKFHAASPYASMVRFNDEDMTATLNNLINGAGVVFKTRHAICGGLITPLLFNHKALVGAELFLFSEKGTGLDVRKAFEKWASDNGAKYIQMSCLVNTKEKPMRRLFRSFGYDAKEVSFLKVV